MNRQSNWTLVLCALLMAAGCSKQQPGPTPVAEPAAAPAAAASAPPASAATRAQPAEPDERAAAIQAALAEDAIVSDARGQWAVAATASSTYGDKEPEAKSSYTAHMATGAPNVDKYSDNGNAWATATPDKGIEWLEVVFANPVHATQIRIRQNYAPGAIIKVELVAENGSKYTVWEGVDDQQHAPGTIAGFDRSFARTADKVKNARITLATNAVPGWNEIDAVQLLGET